MNKLKLIDTFFYPKNITLIGVSRNLMSASGMILSNIIEGGYKGELNLINKNAEKDKKILGRSIKNSLSEIDHDLDLAFVITPSRSVPKVLEECADKNIKAVAIISSGFGESVLYDKEKLKLQDQIVRIAKKNGFIFTGPNCNGVYSELASLNAIFGPRVNCLPNGKISFCTRGGTAGIQSMIESTIRGLGVSKFINLGDSAFLKIQDIIEYYEKDQDTEVIGIYTEGINDADQFIKICKRSKKPIILLKTGQTKAGQRAALSHVGAISGESRIFKGFAKQAGILIVESIKELMDLASALIISYVPKGKNIGILTPAGSLGVMATDACAKQGLNIPKLSDELINKLNPLLPEYWSHNNPIDITDSMDFSIFFKVIKNFLAEEKINGLIVLLGELMTDQQDIIDFGPEIMKNRELFFEFIKSQVKRIGKYIKQIKKPVFFFGPVYAENGLPKYFREHNIIVLPEFRKIARIFAKMVKWKEYLDRKKSG
ncbi:MAG: hypothetical protein GF329_21180 [Candidatus Lokiarchaeota archaeon]|nr:hypothetical protein [Candidatus Lokiarchaeota archaeon]